MRIQLILFIAGITTLCSAQSIPSLPVALGAGTVEVWRGSLYSFGGSNTWGGRDQLYNRVYKFEGTAWSYQDSIPDNNVWGVKSVLVGNEVYLLGGWRAGASMVRKYNLSDRTWTSLRPGPNATAWGFTAAYLDGFIYLFNDRGNVFGYNIAGDTWTRKTPNAVAAYLGLSSVVWQDEIYIVGFHNSGFYKYTPAADAWTQLADTPYSVAACAMGVIDDRIYCMAGSEQGNNSNSYRTILAYEISTNSWTIDQTQVQGRRTWMAAAAYRGEFYIVGGFDSAGVAVSVIEKIVPRGPSTRVAATGAGTYPASFSLDPNYPNPFNPSTVISYRLAENSEVSLELYNLSGQRVRTLVSDMRPAGRHQVVWDGRDDAGRALASGKYFYRLNIGQQHATRGMILIK